MPMTHDRQARNASHDAAADALCALLDEGKTVVFLTLGDPTIYSTSVSYTHLPVPCIEMERQSMTKIDIISGFLGAGKTTLIKRLLADALKGEQVVLILSLIHI